MTSAGTAAAAPHSGTTAPAGCWRPLPARPRGSAGCGSGSPRPMASRRAPGTAGGGGGGHASPRVGERYCYALAGLSQRFEKNGLGTVLLAHTIEQAAAEGATVYDLMWGDESYKDRFATGSRQAGTWYLATGRPSRLALGAAVRGVHALEALPPGAQEPLRRLKRGLRRS